jgi:hypothetical protein
MARVGSALPFFHTTLIRDYLEAAVGLLFSSEPQRSRACYTESMLY